MKGKTRSFLKRTCSVGEDGGHAVRQNGQVRDGGRGMMGHLIQIWGHQGRLPREKEMSKWTQTMPVARDGSEQISKKFHSREKTGVLLDGSVPVSVPQSHAQNCSGFVEIMMKALFLSLAV